MPPLKFKWTAVCCEATANKECNGKIKFFIAFQMKCIFELSSLLLWSDQNIHVDGRKKTPLFSEQFSTLMHGTMLKIESFPRIAFTDRDGKKKQHLLKPNQVNPMFLIECIWKNELKIDSTSMYAQTEIIMIFLIRCILNSHPISYSDFKRRWSNIQPIQST